MTDPVSRAVGGVAERRVAVALSGGVDSVVLLHALRHTSLRHVGVDVCAIHVDHRLRSNSATDAAFCRELCSNLGIQFRCVELDVDRGNSSQGRARTQRYAALVGAAATLGADAIATAHHADDAVESCFLQAWRGAGPVGRAGPTRRVDWQGFRVIRPLLEVSRDEIEVYASTHALAWREDPTNADTDYLRNYVRHEVLPHVDVHAARALMPRLRRRAAELRAAIDEAIDRATVDRTAGRIKLRRPLLKSDDPNLTDGEAPLPRSGGGAERSEAGEAPRRPPQPPRDRGETHRLSNISAGEAEMLIETARRLHGELRGDLVEEIVAALHDPATETRRYCGRNVVVEVSAEFVVLEATRGQGTRLLDARKTPTLEISNDGELAWFRHRLSFRSDGDATALELRGPRDGERRGSDLIRDLLAAHGVPPSERWCWPCLFHKATCVHVAEIDDEAILLPDARFSGIFVTARRLSETDVGPEPTRSGR